MIHNVSRLNIRCFGTGYARLERQMLIGRPFHKINVKRPQIIGAFTIISHKYLVPLQ